MTPGQVMAMLSYDPSSGEFTWRVNRPNRPVGSVAGRVDRTGRRQIKLLGRYRAAHRLAWLCFYGEWPSGDIDHINRNPLDNRIDNLRVVTRSENQQNRGTPKTNTSGFVGVTFNKRSGRWQAQKNRQYLGLFDTPEQAAAAVSNHRGAQ